MQYVSLRNLRFLLHEVLQVKDLTQYPYYQEYSVESIDLMLDAALQLADTYIRPLLNEMDRNEPQLIEGKIRVNPKVRDFALACGEGSWISAIHPIEVGGMQLPIVINSCTTFIFNAANYSASVFPFLTTGAAGLIGTFGSEVLKNTYLPNMYAGIWQGTMALTEPDAGSSLSDITTSATPTKSGHYLIKGQKIYISAGDHDACDNVIHLMLARIKGAPSGVKGISLFVVPQQRIENNALVPNDVQTAGVYHKMGYKGAPIAHLMVGEREDCRGYLVGEAHQGLRYMFQMMNEARIGVGVNAAGIASAAYYESLAYAKVRPQGRKIENKDLSLPQVPIIQHADVKRMLLFQRSVVEGSLALLLQASYYADVEKVAAGELKENAQLLLDFLTPIAKSYPSEMGCLSTSAGVQILGGAGYLTDFNLEQYYREARIHPIHEGTTGIHGLDLLGRKVILHQGKAFNLFLTEIKKTIIRTLNETESLKKLGQMLTTEARTFEKVTKHLLRLAQQSETEKFLADATLYLEMTGIIAIAWQWLKQGIIAQENLAKVNLSEQDSAFYQGKWMTMRYFFDYELPKVEALAHRLTATDWVTVEMQEGWFM
jgi:butyryl-CoA dehydrogenase